jgi:hypothetical protein
MNWVSHHQHHDDPEIVREESLSKHLERFKSCKEEEFDETRTEIYRIKICIALKNNKNLMG